MYVFYFFAIKDHLLLLLLLLLYKLIIRMVNGLKTNPHIARVLYANNYVGVPQQLIAIRS